MELQGTEGTVRGDLRCSIGRGVLKGDPLGQALLVSIKKGATHQGGSQRSNYLVLLPLSSRSGGLDSGGVEGNERRTQLDRKERMGHQEGDSA